MPRILVDRHHADLLYSLQSLFEFRLGVEVYVPVGREWWDEGYWRFGECFGDDRLAQQYLTLHDGIYIPVPEEDCYVTYDNAHPHSPIRCVTREQFDRRAWDFVMPSVQENQKGYARIAAESGARYLYQVGNVGQQIDWTLNPLVLNTSSAILPDGTSVTIHQEIDSSMLDTFGFWPLAEFDQRTVRSFVNAFNRIPGYDFFLAVEAELTQGRPHHQFNFTVHGHEGRDGNISPVDAMSSLMMGAGFGWHNKPVGDGFGHVIHSWAAVGRPLVGQASYYAGTLAAPFWTPETSIDTTGKEPHEIARVLREIARDYDRHDAMCVEIRKTFDLLVDYPAEAEHVRELLGL